MSDDQAHDPDTEAPVPVGMRRQPVQLTQAEVDLHRLSHLPYGAQNALRARARTTRTIIR